MRRLHLVLIGVTAVICGLAIYVLWARPAIVLPTLTVPLSENNVIGAYQRRLGIDELDVILRTDGKVTLRADGRSLASVSYTLDSLNNTSALTQHMLLPPEARTAIRLLSQISPWLGSNLYVDGLFLYYVLPVQVNIRVVRE